jgi:hypothetical protein
MQIPPPVVAQAAAAAQEKSAARMGYYSLLYCCPTATTSHIILPALVLTCMLMVFWSGHAYDGSDDWACVGTRVEFTDVQQAWATSLAKKAGAVD